MTREVIVSGHIFPDVSIERDILAKYDIEVRETDAYTTSDLIDAARDADGLLNQIPTLDEHVFQELESLQVVAQYSVGVDGIDMDAATDAGVLVSHVPDYCVEEVSTHAIALILACLRQVPTYDRSIKSGEWSYKIGVPIHRLAGQTVGFAAFGTIPQRIREKLRGFDVDVVAYDPFQSKAEMASHDVTKVDFDSLLDQSDILSVHTPLTDETENMFDQSAFATMDNQAIIVNCGRGGVIDEVALEEALTDSEIAGAGLDVVVEEPPDDASLLHRDDVVATPHAAWYSEESMKELRQKAARDIARSLKGEEPAGLVNDELA